MLIAFHMESIYLSFQDYWNNNLGGQPATTARKTEENLWLQRGNKIILTQGRVRRERQDIAGKKKNRLVNSHYI